MSALICVDPARVAEFWPHVRGLIWEAMRRGGLSAFWPVESSVLQGRALLWIVWNGQAIESATITEICQTEWRKVCVIVACGGKGMGHWLSLIAGIEDYAKAEGCSAVRIMGREGWQRMLRDYKRTKIVLEKELA